MEFILKHFTELTNDELYDILKARVDIFVVEQNCPYPEIDGVDKHAYHLFLRETEENGDVPKGELIAYLRVIPEGITFDTPALGRVLTRKRRCGLATVLLQRGIAVAQERCHATKIKLEAQTYARSLYEKVGFRQISEEFLEDGIPHIEMLLDLTERASL